MRLLSIIALAAISVASAQIPPESFIAKDPITRQTALRSLASLSREERAAYLPMLVALMHRSKGLLPPLAFAKVGPDALPALFPLLDDTEPLVRGQAAKAIVMIPPVDSKTLDKIHTLIKDPDQWVRNCVAPLLLGLGIQDPEAVATLHFGGGGPLESEEKRLAAVPALIAALRSKDNSARRSAAVELYLKGLVRADIEATFIKAIKDPSSTVRQWSRSALLMRGLSEAASDALLEDEIAEMERKKAGQEQAREAHLRTFSSAEILAPIPEDADNDDPLELKDRAEARAPDGTTVLATVHSGEGRLDLLRFWRVGANGYRLIQARYADETVHLSVGTFRYQGKMYLHVMNLYDGHGYVHTDDFFRVAAGKLTKLQTPKSPPKLAKGEEIRKGSQDMFSDACLVYEFAIYLRDDATCCPSGGSLTGKYIIVGDELKYAKR